MLKPQVATPVLIVGVLLSLTGCAAGPGEFDVQPVQESFRNTGAGYKEQAGNGPLRYVDYFQNLGAAAESATFVLVLREDDGHIVWTGRATVEDIETGETVEANYRSAQPVPAGDQHLQWRVENVIRPPSA